MDKQYLNDEFNRFFEFPTEDKSQVSSVSAKLFAEHIAYPLERELEQLRQRVAELEKEVAHWKNNHETEVRRARMLKERTDMPIERVQAYEQWGKDMAERDKATQYWNIAEGRCDALIKQRDDLLAALTYVIEDLELRARLKEDEDERGVVDIGDGAYNQAKEAIASVKEKA